ncbi:MAG: DUF1207 domain-containing protein [Elusimicrobia bacterium]|nr:DUF1207 domain-containing protein [Elusimicrobiota bacterium]
MSCAPRWTPRWPRSKALLAALLLAAPALAPRPARAGELDLFPRPNEIFPLLLADPRQIQLSASYYRLDGQNTSDIALGHSWGLTRGRVGTGTPLPWLWEADVEGMAYSRFKVAGGVNEFQTVDFFANLPVTVRRGGVAFKGVLFHESSHLGDDYIRRTGDTGFRYSSEGLRGLASLDVSPVLRLYGGSEWLIHRVPAVGRWTLQAGVELVSPDLGWSAQAPTHLFLAEDLQSHERVAWNVDSHLVCGLRLGFRKNPTRSMRFQLGWFDGHSPYGQFYAQRTHYADVSLVFEL